MHRLLDKLRPEMIQLDPDFIANTPSRTRRVERTRSHEVDQKWARKSVTKNVKRGYRGVLVKRYAKYHHMKQLHVRQKWARRQLNERKALRHKKRKQLSLKRKDAVAQRIKGQTKKDGDGAASSILQRFTDFKQQTKRPAVKSQWRRRDRKIHF